MRRTGAGRRAGRSDSIERDRCGIPHIFAEQPRRPVVRLRLSRWPRTGCSSWTTCAARGSAGWPKCWDRTACRSDLVARTVGLNRIARDEWRGCPTRRALSARPSLAASTPGSSSAATAADRVRPARLPPRAVVAAGLPGHRERVPLVSHRPLPGDRHAGAGQAGARRRAALSRVPAGRRGRRGDRAARGLRRLEPAAGGRCLGRPAAASARGRRPGHGRSRGDRQQQLGRRRPALPSAGSRWWPAIRTSPSRRSRAGTRPISAAAASTWRAWPTSACRPSCSAATSASPGASPTTSARCATCIRSGPMPRIPAASCSTAAGSRPASWSRRSSSRGPQPHDAHDPLLAQRADRRRDPAAAGRTQTGPVSLKWLGAYHGGWLTALLAMDRARSVAEFREALRPWHVPTFNLVVADVEGHIAVQSSGRIPLRKLAGARLSPRLGPRAAVDRPAAVRGHAARRRSAARLAGFGQQPAGRQRLSLSAVRHLDQRLSGRANSRR